LVTVHAHPPHSTVTGTFRYRTYENATLVSSKQLTSFSDFRLPLEHSDHLTLEVRGCDIRIA